MKEEFPVPFYAIMNCKQIDRSYWIDAMRKQDEIMMLESFPNAYVAEMAKGILESYEIESLLKKSHMEGNMIASGTMQEAELWVLKKDYQRTKKILHMQFKE